MSWQPGADLDGRYRLEEKIGEGGMGEVWRARHLALESEVAIKFLGTQLAGNEETQERFRVEAKVTAGLRSRHAVQVFDFGVTPNKEPYLVMELLRGEPLSRRIERQGRLDARTTTKFLRDAGKALIRAHGLGIVHRDFKPDNVFLVQNEEGHDEVKVVDFGIAKLIGSLNDVRPAQVDLSTLTGKAHLTRTGGMVGTPHYMGPEQVKMEPNIGPPADIWALGIVAYECLTGRCPFDGDNVLELFTNIQLYKFTPATAVVPSLPKTFDDWFRTACAIDPSQRFSDPLVAVDALEAALGIADEGPATGPRSFDGPMLAPNGGGISGSGVQAGIPYREAMTSSASGAVDDKRTTMQGAAIPIQRVGGKSMWVGATVVALAVSGIFLVRGLTRDDHHAGAAPVPTVVTIAPPIPSTPAISERLDPSASASTTAPAPSGSTAPAPSGSVATTASTASTPSSGTGGHGKSGKSHDPSGANAGGDTPTAPTAAPPPKPTSAPQGPFQNLPTGL